MGQIHKSNRSQILKLMAIATNESFGTKTQRIGAAIDAYEMWLNLEDTQQDGDAMAYTLAYALTDGQSANLVKANAS